MTGYAFDKSAREVDANGHMRVSATPITKAVVNTYYGREIPGGAEIGLRADHPYRLLRHPDELARAAPTFSGLPLLEMHRFVTADRPSRGLIVGSVGTGAAFDGTYIVAPINVWDQDAIDGINSGDKRELSASYTFDADMTPGEYQGERYDGVMRNIRGNHVALVRLGRAGRDVAVADREFDEADHPRDDVGKFTDGGGSASGRSALQETAGSGANRTQSSGGALPAHIQKLKLPPAWTDVKYNADPNASLLAVGKDSKGRLQSVYSKEFVSRQSEAKFARIEELRTKYDGMSAQNETVRQSDSPRIRDSADCLALIMEMGIRPGSETDTGAKVKAYGATTLEGKHVIVAGEDVTLRFIGKKGVPLNLPVHDKEIARMLQRRADASGPDGKLFPATNDKALLDHTHSLDGGGFKTKDFRTRVGTEMAYRLVQSSAKPTSLREYKAAVMRVASTVADKLGNTPVIALQSYINPAVFAGWIVQT